MFCEIYNLNFKYSYNSLLFNNGDWGLGIGDWDKQKYN